MWAPAGDPAGHLMALTATHDPASCHRGMSRLGLGGSLLLMSALFSWKRALEKKGTSGGRGRQNIRAGGIDYWRVEYGRD